MPPSKNLILIVFSALLPLSFCVAEEEKISQSGEDEVKRQLIFYGGPTFHNTYPSEYSRYIRNGLGIEVDRSNNNGGILGVMYKKSSGSYLAVDLTVYGTKDRGYSDFRFYDFRYTVFSIEVMQHHELFSDLTFYGGGAPAWVSEKKQIGDFISNDSILAWPLFAGFRWRINRWFIADARYRHLNLVYDIPSEGEMKFNLGGLFFLVGGHFIWGNFN